MVEYIKNIKINWSDWFRKKAHGNNMKFWLALVAFTESILMPFPTAIFFLFILMAGAKRWLYYAVFTTIFSVLGGIAGYFIGAFFFDTVGVKIIDFYNLSIEVEKIKVLFDGNAFAVNFIGAATPVPYKIFTLTSGFLGINFFSFLSASIVGRFMQFALLGYIAKLFGPTIARLFFKYFNIVVILLIIVFIISLILK